MTHLYASQHHFDFDDLDTLYPEDERKEKRKYVPQSFKDFIDKTISGSTTSIKKLSLKCLFGLIGHERTDQWILNALDRGVVDLDLCLRTNLVCKKNSRQLSKYLACVVISFPPSVLMNKTLVKLTVGINVAHVRFDFKKAVLPVLKSLFLHSVWFHNESLCSSLLRGTPILEELSIHHLPGDVYHGYLYGSREYLRTHETLKRFTFHYNNSFDDVSGYTTFNLPSLFYLDISGLSPFRYSNVKFEDSLVEAKLDVDIKQKYVTVLTIIGWVRNVRTLSLSSTSVKAMYSHCEELPLFLNLRKLSFESNTEQGWEVLPRLLNKSPNLEILVLKDLHYVGNQGVCIDDKNEVKVVEIFGFRGSDRELTQVKCYLLQMQFLQVMKFEIDDDNKEPELISQLLALPNFKVMRRMRMGPFGETERLSGDETMWDETGHKSVALIIATFDKLAATSIQFGYIENGPLVMSQIHGSYGCSKRVVRLNHESEFVTGISGQVHSGGLISSLSIHTNQRRHEAFHLSVDSGSEYPRTKLEFHSGILKPCEFKGFFGAYHNNYLRAINFSVTHIFPDIEKVKEETV